MYDKRIWRYLTDRVRQHGAIIFAIVDSDKYELEAIGPLIRSFERVGIDAVLVGGTALTRGHEFYNAVFRELRQHVRGIPLIIFPGGMGMRQSITADADAIFFLQLISGFNYRYYMFEQLMSAPKLNRLKMESVSVGYILVSSPAVEPACRLTQTRPLKLSQAYDAMSLVVWSECLGRRMVWFDRGSNAREPIPP
ncbi:MAG: geranylgeranylglyceryl/heptaprenylglyceryl phosphate synthase [Candidatus Edwardsbacteria bacterium]|nr:geranylgeranylglyceryl/heptaprenylglyceryl phosphate synthase [Candidatus Edwardsbacteria bacterium]